MDSVSRTPEALLALADPDPEWKAFSDANQRPAGPMPTDINIVRHFMNFGAQKYLASFGPDSATGVVIENTTVTARDGYAIPIRTYRPASPDAVPGPLIVALHGGGFCIGGLTDEEGHCNSFVKDFGATCVNVDYRLAPEHPMPTGILDVFDVVKWIVTHASELGANLSKGFILEGASAGALITNVVGHLAMDAKIDPPITGLVEIATAGCRAEVMPEEYKSEFLSWDQDMAGGLPKDAISMFEKFSGGDPMDPMVSPLFWPTGHKGLPPVFFQVHGRDHFRDHALIYERVLREKEGVKTKLKVYQGLPHGFNFSNSELKASKQHERDTLDGISWLLSLVKKD